MNNKIAYLILGVVVILGGIVFFYPKDVGGPLCGPVCSSQGLHYYKKQCLGIKVRSAYIDAYDDVCYGVPVSEKKCYGVPYRRDDNVKQDIELDCKYPCGDLFVKELCQSEETVKFGIETYECKALAVKCNWGFIQ